MAIKNKRNRIHIVNVKEALNILKEDTLRDDPIKEFLAVKVGSKRSKSKDKKPPAELPDGRLSKDRVKRCLELQKILYKVTPKTIDFIIKNGVILGLEANQVLTQQGDSGDFVYFILRGSVSVKVNERLIATRLAKECVGEMSALDPTQNRCATLIAAESSTVLKLPSSYMMDLIGKNPSVLQHMAIELSERLRERAKFVRLPNPIPRVFMGSSSEGLKTLNKLREWIKGADVHPWKEDVFQPNRSALESLIEEAKKCDFAILILTPDDKVISRGSKDSAPRDNMLFELGLFMGEIGRDRTYLITPEVDMKLPTDLAGITRKIIHTTKDSKSRLKDVAVEINQDIQMKGSR